MLTPDTIGFDKQTSKIHIYFLATLLINYSILRPKKIEAYTDNIKLDDLVSVIEAIAPEHTHRCSTTTTDYIMEKYCVPVLQERFQKLLEDMPEIEIRSSFENWVNKLLEEHGEYIDITG